MSENTKSEKHSLIQFAVQFILLYLLFYIGTIVWIGLATPGKFHVPFIEQYLDYVKWIRQSLMFGASQIAHLFGFSTTYEPNFTLRANGQRGVIIAYDCVGYGLMSFWAAFVLSFPQTKNFKFAWIISGWVIVWVINILRIGLLLVAINKHWPMPLGLDHHTWFNIFAYGAIFAMMYFFERKGKVKIQK